MMLLLRNPDVHKNLDDKLLKFLQSLRRSQSYACCSAEARKIIESVTGQQVATCQLIRPTWESDWLWHGYVMTAWFGDTVCGKKIADALHAAFTELVRFVLDATADHSEQEYADQLRGALTSYLRLRGYPVTKHPDGPEGGRWLWWDGKRHEIPEGQVYRIVAFMWGRNVVPFDDLIAHAFDRTVYNNAVKTAVNRVNNMLIRIHGFPGRLTTNCVDRYVTWKEKT